jgi:hypothetical protein
LSRQKLLRVKDYVHLHETDFNHDEPRDAKEFDKIATACVNVATAALENPSGQYSQLHCNQMADIFRSLLATQRGIRRMLDYTGPIDAETVDVLVLARLQLEGLFSVCLMLEDVKHVTAFVQDHWRKQYVDYLINKEELQLLPRYGPKLTEDFERLLKLGHGFGITPAHRHTVEWQELEVPMPPGMAVQPIWQFPTPGKVINLIKSSDEKTQMLKRLYAKYAYLCSFAHGLGQANLLKNMFDSRSRDRRSIPDSEVKERYQFAVAGEAYLTSFLSIAQCTAELTALYPNDMEIVAAASHAWNQLSGGSFVTKAIWELRTRRLLGAIA